MIIAIATAVYLAIGLLYSYRAAKIIDEEYPDMTSVVFFTTMVCFTVSWPAIVLRVVFAIIRVLVSENVNLDE